MAALRLSRVLAVEGDEVEAELVLATDSAARVELEVVLPEGIELASDASTLLLTTRAGEERSLPLLLRCRRWGAYRLGSLQVRTTDLLGVRVRDAGIAGETILRVYPGAASLRSLVAPIRTQPFSGNRVARSNGEGIEFADVRPYAAGDRVRRINWRQSAMRQTLFVNQQHPERNSDVVVFLDSFADVSRHGESTLDHAVRAAASLTGHYLAERDRVGFVSFGGMVRWLAPSSGSAQLYRIVDALLETEVVLSFAWKDIDVLPARTLTPHALVIALSPLLDDRSVAALLDLRARGFDLVVIDVSPILLGGSGGGGSDPAFRLWRLWREALRYRYERAGVAVVEWDGSRPLAEAVEEVRTFRRFARFASA
jgi:uncharacterized protein (DUF58 family)